MASRLTDILKDAGSGDRVDTVVRDYDRRYGAGAHGGPDERKADYRNFGNAYYDLVTDLYEYGWGRSFHFARRAPPGRVLPPPSRATSIISPTDWGCDAVWWRSTWGCGVGGPAIEIARFCGASIVGVNDNEYQLKRAARQTETDHLDHLVDYLKCDFMSVEAPDNHFDAAFAIEQPPSMHRTRSAPMARRFVSSSP